MTNFKRKKPSRLRGSKTHGYGAMKKHRGAGSRGGRGMAGSGKRGDAKKPSINKDKNYFGKHGFKSIKARTNNVKKVNIDKLEQMLPKLFENKQAEKKGNIIFIDLKKLGCDKLLGSGKIKSKLEINVDYASKKAVEKIAKAGGKVNVLVVKKEKPKKEEKKKEKIIEEPAEEKGEEETENPQVKEPEVKEEPETSAEEVTEKEVKK